jgi:Tol biopolymer transport system component/tRNA A-37 threonylcarbamoyl transferase component Bud32
VTLVAQLSSALENRYRIERELGQGGMATVYLADDVRHDRKVALKVLKPELAAVLGAERFVVEIKTTAALQHPHILPLFDSGNADGFLYYVMPYVQGETLRNKLDRETQLGVDEAVRIATDVADALDYAHRHGVIHRDIKPENILLHDGRPVVADFGIALALSAAAGGRMTETGLSLGTPHYMSPEQATADKDISNRSDIYSLASVLYEMLTGNPPHTGASAQQIIMKIIAEEVAPVTTLRKSVPPNVSAAVAKALEKLPADRFESAKAFSDALHQGAFTYGATGSRRVASVDTPAMLSRYALPVGGALALLGIAAAVWAWQADKRSTVAPVVQLTLDVPNGNPDLGRFAVSGDGSRFAFATDEGIALRDVGQREYRLLAATESAESPSFSPDGEWIVYHANGHLRKVSVAGGSPLAVMSGADSLLSGRVSWGEDGTIVFESGSRLYIVAANGGSPRLLAKALAAEQPRMMPDGRGVLYIDQRQGSKLMYYDLAGDSAVTVVDGAGEGQYLPTGHILYAMPTGGLFTVPFDPKRRTAVGNPTPILADIQPNGGISPFTVTRNGTLVYRAGIDPEYRLLMRAPNGTVDSLPMAPKVLSYARFSPDGRSIAITIGSARGTNRHTAIYDVSLGSLTRFTVEGGGHSPVWSPDGKWLAFTAEGQDTNAEDLFVQPVDRSVAPRRLVRLPNDQHASAWPVDTVLVFSNNTAPRTLGGTVGGGTVAIVNPLARDAPSRGYLNAQWGEYDAHISPDGQWAAFTSDESGRSEVFVRRFPVADAGGVWKVSSGGGYRARWSGDGRTIYYHTVDNRQIRAARVTPGPSFAVGPSVTIMTAPAMGSAWDVDRRSGKLLISEPVTAARARIVVMQHWLDDFRGRVSGTPPGRNR